MNKRGLLLLLLTMYWLRWHYHVKDITGAPSCGVCLCVKMNKDIFEIFSLSGSHTILVFPYQTGWRYSDGSLPNGASNAGACSTVERSTILIHVCGSLHCWTTQRQWSDPRFVSRFLASIHDAEITWLCVYVALLLLLIKMAENLINIQL